MCLLKEQIYRCDFNETVFKDTVFRRCLRNMPINRSVLRQVILDETRTDSGIERMQGAGLTAASGGFNRDELLLKHIFRVRI